MQITQPWRSKMVEMPFQLFKIFWMIMHPDSSYPMKVEQRSTDKGTCCETNQTSCNIKSGQERRCKVMVFSQLKKFRMFRKNSGVWMNVIPHLKIGTHRFAYHNVDKERIRQLKISSYTTLQSLSTFQDLQEKKTSIEYGLTDRERSTLCDFFCTDKLPKLL